MKNNILLFFGVCILSLYTNNLNANTPQKNAIDSLQLSFADSIHMEIQNTIDTIKMDELFTTIKENRKKLKSQYLPLLYEYDKKSEKLIFPVGQMLALDRIGLQHRYNEFYDSAIYYHNRSLAFALQMKDSTQLYYNYNNLAQVYRMQDLCVQAISYFHEALKISNAVGNLKSSSYTMNSLGATYVVQKDYEQAMHYFNASAQIAIKRSDKRTLAYNYGSIGEVFLFQNQNDSAMHYAIESEKLIIELGSTRGLAVAKHLVGQAHFALNHLNEAEKYFNLALTYHIKDNNMRYQALCYAYLGKIKLGQHKTDSAEWFLQKAKNFAKTIHSHENLILINNSLFELYKQTNQWKKAVASLQESYSYQDSILNIANAKEIQSLEIAYKTEQKEQKIKLLSAENLIKNQRIKMGFALIIALIISIILGVSMHFLRKKQAILKQDKLRQQLMLSQMSPHFIFNALGSIQNYMYKNDAKKAISYLACFASLTRSILNNSSAEYISLEEEVETLKNYLELEKMRMKTSFNFHINLPDEIEKEFIQIPPMMLQPFVENAIKHGLNNIDYPGELILNISELKDQIKVEIRDNGIGINKASKIADPNHKSKATEIFKQRLALLKRKYRNIPDPKTQDLSIENKTGTKVLIYLPIISE
ncbi:MAG: histidine kinase [Salinivirgaceae bacterium]|nr:histidine kinase [Salinivirgaceae bacterium]